MKVPSCVRCNLVREEYPVQPGWKQMLRVVFETGRAPTRTETKFNPGKVWLCPKCIGEWEQSVIRRHNESLRAG
jgi:hypothetical protein